MTGSYPSRVAAPIRSRAKLPQAGHPALPAILKWLRLRGVIRPSRKFPRSTFLRESISLGSHPMARSNPKQLVGWREYVALPEWGIKGVMAKVDTGARTSSLHVENIKELASGRLAFDVVLNRRGRLRHIVATPVRVSRVRPSTGQLQQRYVVSTTIRLGDVTKQVELSLVSRGDMLCRMLIGRTALERDFLVDVSGRYLCGKPLAKKPPHSPIKKRPEKS